MTEAQITQLIGILSILVTTLNAFVLFWIAQHQVQVKADLKKFNGTILEAIDRKTTPPQ